MWYSRGWAQRAWSSAGSGRQTGKRLCRLRASAWSRRRAAGSRRGEGVWPQAHTRLGGCSRQGKRGERQRGWIEDWTGRDGTGWDCKLVERATYRRQIKPAVRAGYSSTIQELIPPALALSSSASSALGNAPDSGCRLPCFAQQAGSAVIYRLDRRRAMACWCRQPSSLEMALEARRGEARERGKRGEGRRRRSR